MKNATAVLLAATCLLSGCFFKPGYSVTRLTAVEVSARAPDCDFDVVTLPPSRPFDDVGSLNWDSGAAVGTPAMLKDAIRSQVCAIGGDAVIGQMNGHGNFIAGTVIRWKSPVSASQAFNQWPR